ncbi:MAG: hypothetical protein WCV72_02760 [Patescibacteria group bacterium]
MPDTPPAKNVEGMKTQISQELIEAKKTDLAEKIKPIHDKEKAEKIFWSVRERGDFVAQLKNEMKGDQSNEQLLSLISNEIDNELTENKFDEAAKDYEGKDRNNKKIDENATRNEIENSWEKETNDLKPEQRAKLEKDVETLIREKGSNIDKGEGNAQIDMMVTKDEAQEIAEFIKTEAAKMKDANKNETKANEPENPEAIIAAAEAKLSKTQILEWANKKDANGKFEQKDADSLKKLAEEGKEKLKPANEKVEAFAKNFGLNPEIAKTALLNLIALDTGWFGIAENQTTLATNLKNFETRFSTEKQEKEPGDFTRFSTEVQKKQLEDFFKLKGIEKWKDNPDWLVRYFAFDNVAEDLGDFDKLIQARETKEKAGEIVPPIKVAEQQVEVVAPTNTPESKSVVDKITQSLEKIKQTGGEIIDAFSSGDWKKGFGKILELLFSDMFWDANKEWIGKIWIAGPAIVKAREDAVKTQAAEANAAAPTPAPEQTPEQNPEEKILNDFLGPNAKSKGLETVSMKEFLAENADLDAFAKVEKTGIERPRLEKLRNELLSKSNANTLKTEDKNVFVFLQEKLKEKPDYLKA